MTFLRTLKSWGIDEILRRYPRLKIVPDDDCELLLLGQINFIATAPGLEIITDSYSISIAVPASFPRDAPRVWDKGQRIDPKYHRLTDGSFCLGSPASLRLLLAQQPTLLAFIEQCVIPYLYGYSFFEKHRRPPFGELAHGDRGLIDDFKRLFGLATADACADMLSLIGMKKRVANKQPCPCNSGLRLGKCHHNLANRLRILLGRSWCRGQAQWINDEYYEPASHPNTTVKPPPTAIRVETLRKDADRASDPRTQSQTELTELLRDVDRVEVGDRIASSETPLLDEGKLLSAVRS